jgi:peptidase C39-like protein
MKYAIINTIILMVLAVAGYILTFRYYPGFSRGTRVFIIAVSAGFMILWIMYHFVVFQFWDMLAMIRFLSRVRIEYTSFFIGVFSAIGQIWINNRIKKMQGPFTRHNGVVLAILLMVPVYIYPIIYPVDTEFQDRWKDEVCLQSAIESCAPACIATILKYYNIKSEEEEIATRVYLSKLGTDVWHIARYLEKRGLKTRIITVEEKPENPPLPSLAMVHQEGADGFNHCIVLFENNGNMLLIGDPSIGRILVSKKYVYDNYKFLGYVIHVTDE